MKAERGPGMLIMGSGSIVSQLTDAGLIDEYQVVVHPVVLGGGKPVFPDKDRLDLRLVETRGFDGRSVLLRYERA